MKKKERKKAIFERKKYEIFKMRSYGKKIKK